jgi:signal transduction histidine kinase
VQEALTNVLKHAAGAEARVRLVREQSAVDILVENGPGGSAAGAPGAGHDLVSMRERVALFGGEFDAGPLPGGGFRVHARPALEGAGR